MNLILPRPSAQYDPQNEAQARAAIEKHSNLLSWLLARFGPNASKDAPIGRVLDISGANAGQVKFPATQNPSSDANTLDDYEEGTFTPTLTFSGLSVGVAYSKQFGIYTKIGNRVFFNVGVDLSSKGTSVGSAQIEGLPFVSNAATEISATVVMTHLDASVVTPMAQINHATSLIALWQLVSGSIVRLSNTTLTDTTGVTLMGHYIT